MGAKFTWNIDKVDPEFREQQDEINGAVVNKITEALIHATKSIKLNEISKANAKEWWIRLQIMDQVTTGYKILYNPRNGYSRNPSYGDILARVGLRTNAEQMTTTAWMNRVKKSLYDRYEITVDAAIKEAKERHAGP